MYYVLDKKGYDERAESKDFRGWNEDVPSPCGAAVC